MENLEQYFSRFREAIVGNDAEYTTDAGKQKMIYADWVASGRLYKPIEERMAEVIGPWVANTHTETCESGQLMTRAYHEAQHIIKRHVNAGPGDVLITSGFGMTGVLVKFQRMLNLKAPEKNTYGEFIFNGKRPVVFITHMEHHSNHTSWYHTLADVEVIPPGRDLQVDPEELRKLIRKFSDRPLKIGSFTACSNVTGIETPIHELARIMHEEGGYCFADYAASAPYVDINMHPADPMEKLDAVFFSPHKFLGGPGTSGVLVFDSALYHCKVPDAPGGGTVDWTNPWGEYKFIDDIEIREDGGTPGFLQAMRTALSIRLKEEMGTDRIRRREEELLDIAFREMKQIPGLHILDENQRKRLGIVSFYMDGLHFNLLVKLMSDRFGVQLRGGCACAGTYGHFLLDVSYETSKAITDLITHGDLSQKPGWVRLSLHPTMTNAQLYFIIGALKQVSQNHREWKKDYLYNKHNNEFIHIREWHQKDDLIKSWFVLD
jgi:selenocysteine lyase/cysteine desulfurase